VADPPTQNQEPERLSQRHASREKGSSIAEEEDKPAGYDNDGRGGDSRSLADLHICSQGMWAESRAEERGVTRRKAYSTETSHTHVTVRSAGARFPTTRNEPMQIIIEPHLSQIAAGVPYHVATECVEVLAILSMLYSPTVCLIAKHRSLASRARHSAESSGPASPLWLRMNLAICSPAVVM
jgi:hypothetical protein